jgi:hypothetical protein
VTGFEHDPRSGRFVCPWCGRAFSEPTEVKEIADERGPIGIVETYSHRCGTDEHVTHPFVITPFPDRADDLRRLIREKLPPAEPSDD